MVHRTNVQGTLLGHLYCHIRNCLSVFRELGCQQVSVYSGSCGVHVSVQQCVQLVSAPKP